MRFLRVVTLLLCDYRYALPSSYLSMTLFHQSFRYSKSSMHQSKQNKNSHWRNIFQHFLGDNDVHDCKTNDVSLINVTKSVHLQLGQIVELRDDDHPNASVRVGSKEDHCIDIDHDDVIDDNQEDGDEEEEVSSNKEQVTIIHEYASTVDNVTILASFGSKLKLEHFSVHVYGMNYSAHHNMTYRRVVMDESNSSLVEKYMSLWKDGKYLAASKHIRRDWKTSRDNRDQYRVSLEDTISSNIARMKMLRSDTETLPILSRHLQKQVIRAKHSDHYHYDADRATNDSLAVLKEFSLWFREQFPYYYDQCYHCNNKENNSYLGTVFPSTEELAYTASRTELYLCGSCITSSRFPRFNTVSKILDTRRGRCGEYSILMMLFLDCLGYVTRWVVDREDHVWTEVKLSNSSWFHIDPCEAAVNEPLLYQSWGKNQTFIFAFTQDHIDDVTFNYTSKVEDVYRRRLEEGVNESYFDSALESGRKLLVQSK